MDASEETLSLDAVVERLQAIRDGAGQPSFGEIALGVSRVRRARGLAPEQARVGRTTVYDAFRTGRRRLDSDLVTDIVLALGGNERLADELATRCRAAQSGSRGVATPEPAAAQAERTAPTGRILLGVLALSLAMNLLGLLLSESLDLPVYLDMLGTAFSAIALGPWWGVLVGLITNASGVAASGPDSLLFAPVNAAGALVWGYGVRRWALGRSIPRFFVLNLLAAVACTAMSVPIIIGPLDGFSESGADAITLKVLEMTHHVWMAVTASNLLTSVPDKLIAGFVALTLVEALPASLHRLRPAVWLQR